ncbi:MAG: hypothetical protein HY954_00915 [Deltaproteobacteria bacterium]|nr:hypothetical protein [Deltaproteobacteria bacterium]
MPFYTILKGLAEKIAASGAIMLDWEGEIVASYASSPSIEIDLIGAHHGIILNIIKDASSRSSGKEVRSVSITTSSTRLAISPLKEGYYLVIITPRSVPIGKTLSEAKRASLRLEEEMG